MPASPLDPTGNPMDRDQRPDRARGAAPVTR